MKYATIDNDRYNGTYSGHKFTAWVGDAPDEIGCDDTTCVHFWNGYDEPNHTSFVYGGGDTADQALAELCEVLISSGQDQDALFEIIHDADEYSDNKTPETTFFIVGTDLFKKHFPLTSAILDDLSGD